MEYVAWAKHLPRQTIRAANLNARPPLRLVPQARPSLLWQPPSLSEGYGADGWLRVSPGVARALRYANMVGMIMVWSEVASRLVPVAPALQALPGANVIPGWTMVDANFNAIYYGTQTAEFSPGQVVNGATLGALSETWSFTQPGQSTDGNQMGFTYGTALDNKPIPGFTTSNEAGPSTQAALERLWFGVIDGFFPAWSSRNRLWLRNPGTVGEPAIEYEPGKIVIDPLPLGQPLPAPLAEPGFPLRLRPRTRTGRRLRLRRAVRPNLRKMPSVEINVSPRAVSVTSGRERPPPPGTRERKMRGRGELGQWLAGAIFWSYGRVHDWKDWLDIVWRNGDAPGLYGVPQRLEYLMANPDFFLTVNWGEVFWDLGAWELDELFGRAIGRLQVASAGNLGRPVSMGTGQWDDRRLGGVEAGESFGTFLTSRFREGLDAVWPT